MATTTIGLIGLNSTSVLPLDATASTLTPIQNKNSQYYSRRINKRSASPSFLVRFWPGYVIVNLNIVDLQPFSSLVLWQMYCH
jgi:hypothetical protein